MDKEPTKKTYPSIAVNTATGWVFLQEEEILYCKVEGSYTHIFLNGNKKSILTVAKSLSKVFASLKADSFVRIHNSYVINLLHLMSFNGTARNCVTMADGEVLAVSRARKVAFLERFKVI